MAKIRIKNIGDKILVSKDNKTVSFYNKSNLTFSVADSIVAMRDGGDLVFEEKTSNLIEPKENSPVGLMILLNEMLLTTGSVGNSLENRVVVNKDNAVSILGGDIDSTKEYFLDGIIDIGSTQITVPVGGIILNGYSFSTSGLTSSASNYTMFVSESPEIGSGQFLGSDYFITTSGSSSKVYDLYDFSGLNFFEFTRVRYIDCTSLGDIYGYLQGLESGTGRIGGSPSLTLHGTWLSGYRISTSIVRGMSNATTEPLFKAGTAFVMNSRFLTDINVDLGDLQPLLDFGPANFASSSALQLKGCIVTRSGVSNANDTNLTPNITQKDLESNWDVNNGLFNTFIGGSKTVTTEVETLIDAVNTPAVIEGVFTSKDLQHFDSPVNGRLRHLGVDPKEFKVSFNFVLEGRDSFVYKIELVKYDGVFTTIFEQSRVINKLQGGRNIAYYNGMQNLVLNNNEYLYWQVTNLNDASSCTLEADSSWTIEER